MLVTFSSVGKFPPRLYLLLLLPPLPPLQLQHPTILPPLPQLLPPRKGNGTQTDSGISMRHSCQKIWEGTVENGQQAKRSQRSSFSFKKTANRKTSQYTLMEPSVYSPRYTGGQRYTVGQRYTGGQSNPHSQSGWDLIHCQARYDQHP